MAQEEVYGTRDRVYSAWHRRGSTRRFVGIEPAQTLAMIDLDASLYIEYDDGTKEPLALIETARDVGQTYKCATVTTKLAQRCMPILPAYVLLYTLSEVPNPADPAWQDIASFRVKRLHPKPQHEWVIYTPQAWAVFLVKLRKRTGEILDAEFDA
jgi:hypothetical protein